MRIAIIGGNSDDERHLGRLAERAGLAAEFVRCRAIATTPIAPRSEDAALEHLIERLDREAVAEAAPSRLVHPLRALIFEALDRADAAARVLGPVRRDPYFDRFGTLLVLAADQAGAISLPSGFDDFVLRPCSSDELVIRVRALAHRRGLWSSSGDAVDPGVMVDEASRDVFVDGRAVQLTAREFALFTYLCEWRGKVLSREHLLARVWGSRYSGGRRTVDIHVRRLRAKLGKSLAIETLRGSGYRLRRDSPPPEASPCELSKAFLPEIPPSYSNPRPTAFSAQMPEPFSNVSRAAGI